MKISTKGRYALRMLIELAAHQEEGFMSLKEISEHQGISKKYLEQIVPMLNKSGILRTNRGNKGGYMLAKSPRECTVGDVLRATEGSLAPVACLEYEVNDCPRAESCATLYVWQGLQKAVENYLDSVTIQDILDRNAGNAGNDYCI
ncbi:MAG: Rrf2 family transcriptional regulator [Oscillospiraceae bacterium]|nr:Rrf2 family transcriptional regulator [Oscillospiraceae bacterium]